MDPLGLEFSVETQGEFSSNPCLCCFPSLAQTINRYQLQTHSITNLYEAVQKIIFSWLFLLLSPESGKVHFLRALLLHCTNPIPLGKKLKTIHKWTNNLKIQRGVGRGKRNKGRFWWNWHFLMKNLLLESSRGVPSGMIWYPWGNTQQLQLLSSAGAALSIHTEIQRQGYGFVG